jgi:hypothetical protein
VWIIEINVEIPTQEKTKEFISNKFNGVRTVSKSGSVNCMVMHPVVYSFPEIIKTAVNKINYTR